MVKRHGFVFSLFFHALFLLGIYWLYFLHDSDSLKPAIIGVKILKQSPQYKYKSVANVSRAPKQEAAVLRKFLPAEQLRNHKRLAPSKTAVHKKSLKEGGDEIPAPSYKTLLPDTQNQPPLYPEQARRRGIEGTVKLKAWQEKNRLYVEVLESSGFRVLDVAALAAVKNWTLPSHSTGMTYFIPIEFRLK